MPQITPSTAAANARLSYAPGHRPRRSTTLQAIEIQDRLWTDAADPTLKPAIRALVARSWCLVVDRLRIIRGKPLPGALRPEPIRKPRRVEVRQAPIPAPVPAPVEVGPPPAEPAA